MKKEKLIGWAIIAVVVIAIIYLANKRGWLKKVPVLSEIIPSGTSKSKSTVFPLKRGSNGSEVSKLQTGINKMLANGVTSLDRTAVKPPLLVVDGIYGQKTEDAVNYVFGVKEVDEEKYKTVTQ
jgi:hypothetical protein